MAEYWGERREGWRDAAADEFERIVMPACLYGPEQDFRRLQMVNMCFTEWVLFERPLREGKTPLQLYVETPPEGTLESTVDHLRQIDETQFFARFEWVLFERPLREGKTPLQLYVETPPEGTLESTVDHLRQIDETQFFARFAILDKEPETSRAKTPLQLYVETPPEGTLESTVDHLRQIDETQFFARFAILDKEPETSRALLLDVGTDRRYEVCDGALCKNARWRNGTIAERIACVDGLWQVVGQVHLYDRADPDATRVDGPGALHPDVRSASHAWTACGK